MSATYELVLFAAFGSFVLLAVLGGLATPTTREYLDAKPGLSAGYVAVVTLVCVSLPVVLGAVGEFPSDDVRAMGFDLVLLAFGLVGVALGAGNAARWLRFRALGDTPTGETREGPVSVTGLVAHDDPPRSPFFDREAVAWTWTVEAKNRHGTSYEGRRAWEQARAGQGGVPFDVDDGSGSVHVDPTGASLDCTSTTTEERHPEDPPGRAAEITNLDMGGEQFRFTESVLSPGVEVTVLGAAREGDEGVVLAATDDEPFVVSEGGRASTLRRYAIRGVGFGLAGGLAVWFGGHWLLEAFGLAVPM
ncbi:GIDE domain-containing protein [Halorarius litoreus]|uniref:GIDE domain-containing protein n=1 Tax=Halorarius litoreus TaxID=2962676 RepID=UPI0020CD9AA8|nr:GIDE domain-containing protein [Halorarius litoreus]